VHLPVLPLDYPALHFERYALRLGDVDRFDILPVAPLCFYCCWMVTVGRCLIDGSSNGRDIDVDYFLRVAVEDWGEVEWIRVLTVVGVRSVVHEGLLQSNLVAESLVETNGPGCVGVSIALLPEESLHLRSQ